MSVTKIAIPPYPCLSVFICVKILAFPFVENEIVSKEVHFPGFVSANEWQSTFPSAARDRRFEVSEANAQFFRI